MDELSKLTRDRSNLAFDSATVPVQHFCGAVLPTVLFTPEKDCLDNIQNVHVVLLTLLVARQADINKLADDFEEQLKASREKLEVSFCSAKVGLLHQLCHFQGAQGGVCLHEACPVQVDCASSYIFGMPDLGVTLLECKRD